MAAAHRLVGKTDRVGGYRDGVVVDLGGLRGWTSEGLQTLAQRTGSASQASVAVCASPAGFALATVGKTPTYPSADLAVQGLLGRFADRYGRVPAGRTLSLMLRHSQRSFPAHPSQTFAARHWLRAVPTEWRLDGRIDQAVLALTELVTNSIRHTDSDTFSVTLRVRRDRRGARILTVSVGDCASAMDTAAPDVNLTKATADGDCASSMR
ncbi:ATP-binding protein [Micromonospora tulbaghiae]|uniref:ATP-binding protein n=1 Tax=Micromonospora tulbaghiae TaxID=479978 RepID=UPI003EBDD725